MTVSKSKSTRQSRPRCSKMGSGGKRPQLPTVEQISAGGVAFRRLEANIEVAVILTAPEERWQLPKGIIDQGETPEQAALREVREEAGIVCRIVEPIEQIEYWFFAAHGGIRRRYHKFVHFFLMIHESGDVADHDHEVAEARWVTPEKAAEMLAFKDEKRVLATAADRIRSLF